LEGGSGILSVLKAIVTLERGMILPNANFEIPNPDIDFTTLRLKVSSPAASCDSLQQRLTLSSQVPTSVTPWPSYKAMRVSINNFGFGGSNAHAILERHTEAHIANDRLRLQTERKRLYLLSAKCKTSLQANIAALQSYVSNANPSCESDFMLDLSTTLCDYRTTFKRSHAVVASTQQQLVEKLGLTLPAFGPLAGPTIFVFTGQGAQWAQMGLSLMKNENYSATMHDADRYLRSLGAPWSLIGV
jgi:acyl transferase domain-containing protein